MSCTNPFLRTFTDPFLSHAAPSTTHDIKRLSYKNRPERTKLIYNFIYSRAYIEPIQSKIKFTQQLSV